MKRRKSDVKSILRRKQTSLFPQKCVFLTKVFLLHENHLLKIITTNLNQIHLILIDKVALCADFAMAIHLINNFRIITDNLQLYSFSFRGKLIQFIMN